MMITYRLFVLLIAIHAISLPGLAQDSNLELVLPVYSGWNVTKEGESVEFTLEVAGDNINSVSYTILNGKLEGMQLDSAGNFSWKPDFNLVERLEEHKVFPVIFEVENTDGEKNSKQTEFVVLHQNRPPQVKELKPFYIKYGVKNTYTIDPTSVIDLDNDPWVFKSIPTQMPEGLSLSENGKFEWKPSLTQYRRLREEPLLLGFIIEDQPGKAQQKGQLLIKATHLDLPPEISMLPAFDTIKVQENETINIKFFLSDPN